MFRKIFITILLCLDYGNCINLCDDWIQYKDQKCIKVLEKKGTEEEALKNCTQLDRSSTLLSIHSKDEQEYLNSLLEKYHNISLNVWLGLKYTDKAFKWMDGTNTDYNNWSEDAVKDGSAQCVDMSLIKETIGKWIDVSCKKPGLIVCQRKQTLDLNALKNAFETQEKQIKEIQTKNENLEKEVKEMRAHPMQDIIPVGFIYTQLPDQPSPEKLWPSLKWTEVSSLYSGLFFRAEGEGSETFGRTQQANQSWVSDIDVWSCKYDSWSGSHCEDGATSLNRTNWVEINRGKINAITHLLLYTTGGEVRPKNTAVRIFKRIQ